MAIYGFCHYSDGAPVIGWEAIGPHVGMTNEHARREILLKKSERLWELADEMTERIMLGEEFSWDDVLAIQAEAEELGNKAFRR